ncbi:hypothetical protein TNCV_2406451 [Trichonephila clavipes]|nr:hypothetical protein TNCV_2406451 [Trichonephila clavipes]
MRRKEEQKCLPEERSQPAAVEEEKGLSKDSSNVPPISAEDQTYESASSSDGCFSNGGRRVDCVEVLRCFSTNPLGESLGPSIELFHNQPSQEETLICRLVIRYKEEVSNLEEGGKEAELLNAMWLWASLGHQFLPPTDLGRVDEEMTSISGRLPQSVSISKDT